MAVVWTDSHPDPDQAVCSTATIAGQSVMLIKGGRFNMWTAKAGGKIVHYVWSRNLSQAKLQVEAQLTNPQAVPARTR